MRLILLFLLLSCSTVLSAQPIPQWARSYGEINDQGAEDVLWSQDGGIISCGFYRGLISFGSAPDLSRNSAGMADGYILKQLDTGATQWVFSLSSSADITATSVAESSTGEIYCTGTFSDTLYLAQDTLISEGASDVFILKLDALGDLIWARNFGGPTLDRGVAIELDAFDRPHIACEYRIYAALGQDTLWSNGAQDVALLSLDPQGELRLWSTHGGEGPNDKVSDLATGPRGLLYLYGTFRDAVDFDPGPGEFLQSASSNDIYLTRLDSLHQFRFTQIHRGVSEDEAGSIDVDSAGIYLTGRYKGALDVRYLNGDSILMSQGLDDAYVVKLGPQGQFEWASSLGDTLIDVGLDVMVDHVGHVYVSGFYTGEVDLDPSMSDYAVSGIPAIRTMYLQKFDAAGQFIWGASIDGEADSYAEAMDVRADGALVLAGRYKGMTDFAAHPPAIALDSDLGGSDAFIVRFDQCIPTYSTDAVTACGSYIWGAMSLDSTGVYTQAFARADGCDSIVTLAIEVLSVELFELEVSGCDSAAIGDEYTYVSGSFEQVFERPGECDSVIVYIAEVFESQAVQDTVRSCGPVSIEGIEYLQSTDLIDTLSSSTGCDSIVFRSVIIESLEATIAQVGAVFVASDGDAFQWLDCADDFSPLLGEIGVSYSPTISGSYAVIVSSGLCNDTTECLLSTVGISELVNTDIGIYPNPFMQDLFIAGHSYIESVSLHDAMGRLVYQQVVDAALVTGEPLRISDLCHIPLGFYTLSILTPEGLIVNSILKQ